MGYPINVSGRGPAFLKMYSAVHGKSGPLNVLDRLIHQCDWCRVALTSLDITVDQLWSPFMVACPTLSHVNNFLQEIH